MSHRLDTPHHRGTEGSLLTVPEKLEGRLGGVESVPALPEPLTVPQDHSCGAPCCSQPLTGRAEYCSQECRNNMHAVRRVRQLLEGLSDEAVLKVIRGY